ncbi:hypothetical protein E4F37_33075 [Burkholderia pseudomallei]|nr:hypothetical protein E4F37_33075 [Burkholderia pseudomallei]
MNRNRAGIEPESSRNRAGIEPESSRNRAGVGSESGRSRVGSRVVVGCKPSARRCSDIVDDMGAPPRCEPDRDSMAKRQPTIDNR